MRGGLLAALLCVALTGWCSTAALAAGRRDIRGSIATTASSTQPAPTRSSVLVVFLAPAPLHPEQSEDDAIESELSSIPTLSTGILSATQGTY
ncbi:MAG TPA: hypothetical protein VK701_09140, partial [Solirubrobacteraceae bacterium]|nr:hypothetical protein [Solirubrobacteraceae bacterium]